MHKNEVKKYNYNFFSKFQGHKIQLSYWKNKFNNIGLIKNNKLKINQFK